MTTQPTPPRGTITVGFDGSASGHSAVHWAAQEAAASSAKPTPAQVRCPRSIPSSTTPTAARNAQARSRVRRLPATARANGPRNSMVTAIPRGIRANDW